MKKGFTLIEMLVVIGIIMILMGASVAGYSKMTKSAERAKTQELVSNVATALTALFQEEGVWPKRLREQGKTDGQLDKDNALVLAKHKVFTLSTDNPNNPKYATKLLGLDQFGIVTPWAMSAIKRAGNGASEGTIVGGGSVTVRNHILHFALDLDGDGVIEGANVGGESVDIRATAAVWCIGKSGGNKGDPWPYSKGRRKDDVYSWTYGQTQNVTK